MEDAPRRSQLEGYVQPQQASPHTLAGQCLAVETLVGGGSVNQHHSGSPTPNSGDISKGIDRVIEETVSKAREEEEVGEVVGRGYHTIQTWSAPSGLPISVYLLLLVSFNVYVMQSQSHRSLSSDHTH